MPEAFVPNYLIGLREGLEATLVVSILITFLVKSNRRDKLGAVWAGVGTAATLSIGIGAVLTYLAKDLFDDEQRELFVGVSSLIAVGFVTWMIFWMRRFARGLAGELRTKMATAVGLGTFAVAATAFLAVAREGLETALLFYTVAHNATQTAVPLASLVLGILSAVGLGRLIVVGGLRINLSAFFSVTAVLLILIAAGIARYGVHDLMESGIVGSWETIAFDVSNIYDESAWYAALLGGMFNLTSAPTVLETIVWIGYAVPVLILFLWPARAKAAGSASPADRPAVTADATTEGS